MDNSLKNFMTNKLTVGFLISAAYLLIMNDGITLLNVSDSLFIVGMVYMIIGLFRLTKKLELYNILSYGWKKMIAIIKNKNFSGEDSELGSYYEYSQAYEYGKAFKGFLKSGSIMIVVAIIIGM